MRLEPARAVVPCAARGRRARTSLPSGSSALASPPPGGLPGRLALGCPRSLRPGPTILQSRLPELGRGSPALSAGKCRERLGRSPGARHTAEAGKTGGGAGASPQGRLGHGDLPPSSRRLVAPHLLRGPHSTLNELLPWPGRSLPAPSHSSHVVEAWLVSSYLTFPLIFISI